MFSGCTESIEPHDALLVIPIFWNDISSLQGPRLNIYNLFPAMRTLFPIKTASFYWDWDNPPPPPPPPPPPHTHTHTHTHTHLTVSILCADLQYFTLLSKKYKLSTNATAIMCRHCWQCVRVRYSGPFHKYGLALMPVWISNNINLRCGMELLIHSRTSTVSTDM